MRERRTSYLVVIEREAVPQARLLATHGRPVGVLTAHDMASRVVARGADARQLTVSDLMTPRPSTIDAAEPLQRALRAMRQLGVRHMPVVESGGRLSGVLSLDDVLDVLTAADRPLHVPTLRPAGRLGGGATPLRHPV
jgi:CBS domain-containing protein